MAAALDPRSGAKFQGVGGHRDGKKWLGSCSNPFGQLAQKSDPFGSGRIAHAHPSWYGCLLQIMAWESTDVWHHAKHNESSDCPIQIQ